MYSSVHASPKARFTSYIDIYCNLSADVYTFSIVSDYALKPHAFDIFSNKSINMYSSHRKSI